MQHAHLASYDREGVTRTFSELTGTGSYLQRLGAQLGFTKEMAIIQQAFSHPRAWKALSVTIMYGLMTGLAPIP